MDQLGVLLLAISGGCALLTALGGIAMVIDRWLQATEADERRQRTSEPRMWRHPMARRRTW